MEHKKVMKNRLTAFLLSMLCCVVIFGMALWANFGFAHAVVEGNTTRATGELTLTEVTVTKNDGWIFTENTPTNAPFNKMVGVTVTYTSSAGDDPEPYTLDLSKGLTAPTGETVVFSINKYSKTLTATVTRETSTGYAYAQVSGSLKYTESNANDAIANDIHATYLGGATVKTNTQLSNGNLMSKIEVREALNDGSVNNNGIITSFSLSGDLYPTKFTEGMTTYDKELTVTDTQSRSSTVLITNVTYVAPDSVPGLGGNLTSQTARSKALNLDGLTVTVMYNSPFLVATPAASVFPSSYFRAIEYTDENGQPVVDDSGNPVINTSVKNIKIGFTYPGKTEIEQTYENISILRIPVHTPTFPGGRGNSKSIISWNENGASIDITGWDYPTLHTDTGNPPNPQISVYELAPITEDETLITTSEQEREKPEEEKLIIDGAGKKTVKFQSAGKTYRIKVTLSMANDFMWDSPYNGKQDDSMTMSFDVQVDKGSPTVTMGSIPNVEYGTGNANGSLSAKIGTTDMGKTWVYEQATEDADYTKKYANPAAGEEDKWRYDIKYYTQYTSASNNTPVPDTNLRDDGKPKNVGTYYAVAVTYENSGYYSVRSAAVSFEIEKFEIETTVADKTYTRESEWTIDDFFGTGAFAYEDKALDVLTVKDKTDGTEVDVTKEYKFKRAKDYTVGVTVNSGAENDYSKNYKIKGDATEVEFSIKTRVYELTVDLKGWTYGSDSANTGLKVTWGGDFTDENNIYPMHAAANNAFNRVDTNPSAANFKIEYFEAVKNDTTGEYEVKGDALDTTDTDWAKKLAIGDYIVRVTARQDNEYSDTEETAETTPENAAKVNVDYTLPVAEWHFVVTADRIEKPTLDADWSMGNGDGVVYTFNDRTPSDPFTLNGFKTGDDNLTAGGDNIITVTIVYNTPSTNSTVEYDQEAGTGVGFDYATGTFKVIYAGAYTVTISLNPNYEWKAYEEQEDGTQKEISGGKDDIVYLGKVARQQLTVLGNDDVTGTEDIYSGYSQIKTVGDLTVKSWNKAGLKVTDVTGKTVDGKNKDIDPATIVKTALAGVENNGVIEYGNTFDVKHAGKYTVTVDIADKDNYEWVVADGAEGDETDELRTLSLEYTLERATINVQWYEDATSETEVGKDGTLDEVPNTKYPRFEFDGALAAQKTPTAKANIITYPDDNDKLGNFTYELYSDAFHTPVTSITDKGHYFIAITGFSKGENGDASADYRLPIYGTNTAVGTIFEIFAKELDKPTLIENIEGVTVDNNARTVKVTYNGTAGYDFKDWIDGYGEEGQYYVGNKYRITVEVDNSTDNKIVDVKYDGSAITHYTVTVTIDPNYTWKNADAGKEQEDVVFQVTVDPKAVDIVWNVDSLTTTYDATKIADPTYTVDGTFDGDALALTLRYKKTAITDAADVTVENAGTYVVYAYELVKAETAGDSVLVGNYKIDTANDDYHRDFTVEKKALAKPTLKADSFNSVYYGTTKTSGALYGNTETEKAEWKNGEDMLFTASVTAKRDKGWFDERDTMADTAAVLTVDTSDATKYAFDPATGILTYDAAGIYSIKFTLTDPTNYCWSRDDKEQDFAEDVVYSCDWNNENSSTLTVNRKPLTAPALGNDRAMEAEKPITDLSATLFTGTTDGATYTTLYGTRNDDGTIPETGASATQAGGGLSGAPVARGQYYAVLTANDGYNYTWSVDPDGENNTFARDGFITPKIDGKVFVIKYTAAEGAKVYLLYAITATQLEVVLEVSDYTYGDNGYSVGDVVITQANKAVRDYTFTTGDKKIFDFKNHKQDVTTSEGTVSKLPDHADPVFKFYSINDGARTEVAAENMVEGLPWKAGEYEADITIEFDNAEAYQKWTGTRGFTVEQREIDIIWTLSQSSGDFAEKTLTPTADGITHEETYNGLYYEFKCIVTNVPKKTETDTPEAPVPNISSSVAGTGKVTCTDTGTYSIGAYGFNYNVDKNKNYKLTLKSTDPDIQADKYNVKFKINPKKVTLTAVDSSHTYGDALDFAAATYLTSDTIAQFYERDFTSGSDIGSLIRVAVYSGNAEVTASKNVTVNGTFVLRPMFKDKSTNIRIENYVLDDTVENNVTDGALTVNKRAIEVTLGNTDENLTSVYGSDIKTINVTYARTGGVGDAFAPNETEGEVFSVNVYDAAGNVITNKTNVGEYDIILVLTDKGATNYTVTFGGNAVADKKIVYDAKKYSITEAAIDVTVEAAEDLVYSAADKKGLKDGYTAVVVNDEIAANAPVWTFVETDETFGTDGKTFEGLTDSKYPTVHDAGTYYFVVKVTAKNHSDKTVDITVNVEKAVLRVRFDATVMFGEDDPAAKEYLFGLDNLRKEATVTDGKTVGWTVDDFKGADRNKFYSTDAGEDFYGLAGEAKYTVTGYDQATLTSSYPVGVIVTKIVDGASVPTLTCKNYTFDNDGGTLTVVKPQITVTVKDQTVTYNQDEALPELNTENVGYTVAVPDSTYGDGKYAPAEAYSLIFTISTTAHSSKPTATAKTGAVGSYAITGSNINLNKYDIEFKGSWSKEDLNKDKAGTYTINPATLDVKAITGYDAVYDEEWHGLSVDGTPMIDPENGQPKAGVLLATASDGSTVAVEYRMSSTQLSTVTESDFNGLTDIRDRAPSFRDVGRYYVCYRLSNANYTVVRACQAVVIKQADNELTSGFDFGNNSVVASQKGGSVEFTSIVKDAWTYGYKVENGFDPEVANKVTEPVVKFKYTGGADNEQGVLKYELFYDTESIKVKGGAGDTIKSIFDELFAADGLNAGNYRLRVTLGDSKNYVGFIYNYVFRVAKRALTVKAATPDEVTYGYSAPEFTDASEGLVVNSSATGAKADTIAEALGATPVYTTVYNVGDDAGKTYRVFVTGKADNEKDDTSFTNYSVTYRDADLTVVKRKLTVKIEDKQNTYNLQGDEAEATLTYKVTGGDAQGIYSSELTGGVKPDDGVYTNANQSVLELKTDALTGTNGIATNDVIWNEAAKLELGYTIYAVYKTDNASINYEVSFDSCTLEETGNNAIGAGEGKNAGSFRIIQATFEVRGVGVFHKVNDVEIAQPSDVYSGAENYYKAELVGDALTEFSFNYYKYVDNQFVPLGESEKVINVGRYEAEAYSLSDNYKSGSSRFPINITPATLTLKANDTTVQYGTALSGNVANDSAVDGAVTKGRFGGFTYTASSNTLLQEIIDDYQANTVDGELITYSYSSYSPTTSVGTAGLTILPECSGNDNITIEAKTGVLTVLKRKVTVTMVGWDEANATDVSRHNASAWCYYQGNHAATATALKNSFGTDIDKFIYIADETEVFGASGDKRVALGISVDLPAGFNVGEYDFDYEASDSTNYDVTFTNTVKPKFSVQKAHLTLTVTVLGSPEYGDAIVTKVLRDAYTTSDRLLQYSVDGMQKGPNGNTESFTALLVDRNIGFVITGSDGSRYTRWVSGHGAYTVGIEMLDVDDVGSLITDALFDNYKIVAVETKTMTVVRRAISATTPAEQTFGFAADGTHGGLYGKLHTAEITFSDSRNNAEVNGAYVPTGYTRTYNTETLTANGKTYQTAGEAPTVVGDKYTVEVELDHDGNYTFADGGYKVTLPFKVVQMVMNESNFVWNKQNISTENDPATSFANVIASYNSDYMQIISFTYSSTVGTGRPIEEGSASEIGTYYFDADGAININVNRDLGSYEIRFRLTDVAMHNIKINCRVADTVIQSFTVTSAAVVMEVDLSDFAYGDMPSVTVTVDNNVVTTGLAFTYARVTDTDTDKIGGLKTDSKNSHGITLTELGDLAHNPFVVTNSFAAGYYVLSAEYRGSVQQTRYYVFQVTKRIVDAPEYTPGAYTFNGAQQDISIDYDSTVMRPVFDGVTTQTANGMMFSATAARAYDIKFVLLDSANYEWSSAANPTGDTVTFVWTIARDESDNGSETDPVVSLPVDPDPITYGGSFNRGLVTVKSGYNGSVTLFRMPKTDDNAPAVGDAGWVAYDTSARGIAAGDYWLKAVVTDITGTGGNNYSPKAAVGMFTIVPREITATVSGSMIYGTDFKTGTSFRPTVTGILAGDPAATLGSFAYDFAETYAKINAGGDYDIILDTDSNGVVCGIDAGSNYIVKAARGKLTVTKRDVVVTLTGKSSDYTVTPDVSDVEYTVSNLAPGEDKSVLGIEFATTATATSAAGGTYWITIDSYDTTNYVISYDRVLYVINRLEITVTLTPQTDIVYGDEDIVGATAGEITIGNTAADAEFVRNNLTLNIRYSGTSYASGAYNSNVAPTEAGEYTATLIGANSNYILIGTPSVNFVINKRSVDASKFSVEHATYTGEELSPTVMVEDGIYDETIYTTGDVAPVFTEAGDYDITVELVDRFNYAWSSTTDNTITLKFIIGKALDEETTPLTIQGWQYGTYSVRFNSPYAEVKSGSRVVYEYSLDGGRTYTYAAPENGNAGTYYVRIRVAESDNYNAYVSQPVKFEISKYAVALPTLTVIAEGEGKNDTYTGSDLSAPIRGYDAKYMIVGTSDVRTFNDTTTGGIYAVTRDAGEYEINITLLNTRNYEWVDGAGNDGVFTLRWTVAKKKVARPTAGKNSFVVGGGVITYLPAGFDPEIMAIEKNKFSYGGDFTAVITLKDTKNYEWATDSAMPAVSLKWHVTGSDTVFAVIITILSVLAVVGCGGVVTQLLLDKRRKRVEANTMNDIENKDAETGDGSADAEQNTDADNDSSDTDDSGEAEADAEADATAEADAEGEKE